MFVDLQELQQQAERDTVRKAEERYLASQSELEPADRRAGSDFLSRTVRPLAEEIGKDQSNITHGKGPLPNYALPILSLHKTTLALLALRTIINRIMDSDDDEPPTYSDLAVAIGKSCYWEWRQRQLSIARRGKSPKEGSLPDIRKQLLARHTSRRGISRVEEQITKFENRDWPPDHPLADFVALGGRILQILESIGVIEIIGSLPIRRGQLSRPGATRAVTSRKVALSEDFALRLDQLAEDPWARLLVDPVYKPMLVPPRPWTGTQGGGFLIQQNPELTSLVKHRDHPVHIAALKRAEQHGQLELVCAAVNALQETPWRLNQRIHAVIQYAWRNKILLPGLPDQTKPESLREQLKPLREKRQQMKKREQEPGILERKDELRREWGEYRILFKLYRTPSHERVALLSRILRFERLLETCEQLLETGKLVDELRFYFPFQLDYRGRAYSMVTSLSPQGNDHERALLEFADGKPLGEQGEFWLAVHVANTYGNDKVSFDERVDWVKQNTEHISNLAAMIGPDGQPATRNIANLPKETREFWEQADKPWSFLAACLEWQSHNTPDFVSHLPIALDASASGFQHLSALSRDYETAKATNLLPAEKPQDIYQRVADALRTEIEARAAQGDEQAIAWKGKINRNTVKRGVMTTPYGVTLDGRIEQLCEYIVELEEQSPGQFKDKDPWSEATYLAKALQACIQGVATKALEVMRWLQDVAIKLYEDFGLGVSWTTPAGFPVVVEHYRDALERYTWTNPSTGRKSEVVLRSPKPLQLGIDRNKQKNSIGPNFIHSLDAAHMMLTLHRLQGEGLHHFSVVHDSYAVHACDIPSMRRALKEEFVGMYRKPLLEQFLDEQIQNQAVASGRDHVPETLLEELRIFKETCPRPGGLDIEEVLRSEYMFS